MSSRKYADLSPVGWFIASYIEITEPLEDALSATPDRQVMSVWENRLLIAASTPEEAYSRTLFHLKDVPRDYLNTEGIMLRVSIPGITSLLPIYETLEDGSEIEWIDHGTLSLNDVKGMIRTPSELRVKLNDKDKA